MEILLQKDKREAKATFSAVKKTIFYSSRDFQICSTNWGVKGGRVPPCGSRAEPSVRRHRRRTMLLAGAQQFRAKHGITKKSAKGVQGENKSIPPLA